jgi:hypothetical protein
MATRYRMAEVEMSWLQIESVDSTKLEFAGTV